MWYFNEILQHTWTVNSKYRPIRDGSWTQQSAHNGTPVLDKERQADVLVSLHQCR